MQIPRTQKASLRRMCMDPTTNHQAFVIHIIKQIILAHVCSLAGVGSRGLIWDDEVGNEESVGENAAAENTAGFEIGGCVLVG